MKHNLLTAVLAAILMGLQYPLWFGSGGVLAIVRLSREIQAQRTQNAGLTERNQVLAAEVVDLKHGLGAVEQRARLELGMIKQGETFYQVFQGPAGAKK